MKEQLVEVEPATAVEQSDRGELALMELLTVLARRKKFILQATLGAALLALVVSLLMPNWYTATARILPPQQSQSLAASLMGQLGSLAPVAAMAPSSIGLKNPNDIYVGMLQSRTIEDALIGRFDLMRVYRARKLSDARKDLEKYSAIELGTKGFIAITVEDKSPTRAADIANGYVEELRKKSQYLAVTEAAQRRLFFEQQLVATKDQLASAEQALKQTQQKTGMIQLDDQTKAIIETVVKQRAEIAAKEVQLRVMRSSATERNPDLLRVEQEVAGMRAQLANLEMQGGGSDGNIQVATGKVPEAGLEYIRKLRDVKYYETIFELIAKQFEAAKLDEAKNSAVIQTLDPAIEPDRRSSPDRALIVVLSALLGFLGSCIYLFGCAFTQVNPEFSSSLSEFRSVLFGR